MSTVNAADAVYLGADLVDAIYYGNTLVWPQPPAGPPVTGWVLWLDPNTLSLGNLNSWPAADGPDTSTVYAPSVAKPQVVTAGANKVVHFTAQQGKVLFTHAATGDYTVFGTVRATTTTIERTISTVYPAAGNWLVGHHASFGQDKSYGGSFVGPGAAVQAGVWKRYVLAGEGSVMTFWSDKTLMGSGGAGERCNGQLSLSGYATDGLNETSTFDCGEIIIYSRVLTAPEREAVSDYLQAKWA
jgi:hypothetical protein